ncbi:helix-turn-helix domain-containing protein [Candidatus Micrarchaeota archaeon]|nr:helix-turn-helix domain-containing protein [Candidatus Micrarchaeota archaeon]
MIPESKYIESELILRKMSLPEEVLLTRKSLIRWIALSLGLVSPQESRTNILELLDLLIKNKEGITAKELSSQLSMSEKTIYYHLQKLVENGFLKRKKGSYYISDSSLSQAIKSAYQERFELSLKNISKALDELDR